MTQPSNATITVERLNQASKGNHHEWLGFTVTAVEPGYIKARLLVRPDHLNPGATLHGGVTVSVADSLCGYGAFTALADGADGFTTINLTAHYLRRATEGETLTGVATLIQGGRQLQTWDVAIATNGRIVAQVRLTQLLRYPRP